jgi:glutamate N-acetyltransferase/amino-acid N-acetyltransferase
MTFFVLEDGHAATPPGWRAGVAACGIKYTGRDDLALLVSDTPCVAAALFTRNLVKSAHILYDQAVLSRNTETLRVVLINSGSANACTGPEGVVAAGKAAQAAEAALHLPETSTLVMSTGVIGIPLPVEKIAQGIGDAVQGLDSSNGPAAARAIMTTDTRPKQCAAQVTLAGGQTVTIGGMAKGSGMIHPDMATMLAVVTSDVAIAPHTLSAALKYATDRSFNAISVDGDTSTNDTILALANGQAENPTITDLEIPDGQTFLAGLLHVCQYLAREVARDGEGATKLITITVSGATSREQAHRAAMTIARSPLVKTAFAGADPNWGRMVCALGYSGVTLVPEHLTLQLCGVNVFAEGVPLPFDERTLSEMLEAPEVDVVAHLNMGDGEATIWTCDFTQEYIRINADYRT